MATGLLVIGAYLLGAIPFGLLIGLARGIDVRQQGSRNIGATNVGRVLGKKWGYLCLLLDLLKGLAPTLAARFILLGDTPPTAGVLLQWLLVALAAVLGHVFPIYLRFRGGKGVSTTIGVGLGIYPYLTVAMVVALLGYGLVRKVTGWVSAGSLTIAVLFPLAFLVHAWIERLPLAEFWPLLAATVVLGALIIVRHRSNIERIVKGNEIRAA